MKPFLQGRPVQKGGTTRPFGADSSDPISRAKAAANAHQGVNVECVKQGEKVVKIKVTCTCGEIIEIDCLYPPGL